MALLKASCCGVPLPRDFDEMLAGEELFNIVSNPVFQVSGSEDSARSFVERRLVDRRGTPPSHLGFIVGRQTYT